MKKMKNFKIKIKIKIPYKQWKALKLNGGLLY